MIDPALTPSSRVEKKTRVGLEFTDRQSAPLTQRNPKENKSKILATRSGVEIALVPRAKGDAVNLDHCA